MQAQTLNMEMVDLMMTHFIPRDTMGARWTHSFTLNQNGQKTYTENYAYYYLLDTLCILEFSLTSKQTGTRDTPIWVGVLTGPIQPYEYGEGHVIGTFQFYDPDYTYPYDENRWFNGVAVALYATEIYFYTHNDWGVGITEGFGITSNGEPPTDPSKIQLKSGSRLCCSLMYRIA